MHSRQRSRIATVRCALTALFIAQMVADSVVLRYAPLDVAAMSVFHSTSGSNINCKDFRIEVFGH